MNKLVKIIFAGTPSFAVPYLDSLMSDPDFSVLGVLTQPDRPSGRKQELSPAPIKIAAQKNNLTIWQPEKLKNDSEIIGQLEKLGADLLVVVAYGQIIPQNILKLFPRGCINVHPSLLPKYRGASPIQSALLAGEPETGVSIMLMDDERPQSDIETLKAIDQQVKSGADLTKQLLGFARAGKYEMKPTNLNELIQKTSAIFGRTKKEITIHRKYADNVWTVDIDRGQIEQCLLNLYVNAWQAMPGGGDLY